MSSCVFASHAASIIRGGGGSGILKLSKGEPTGVV